MNSLPSRSADSQALDWFVRRGAGLDAAEEALFQDWLAADATHQAALARRQHDWDALDALPAAGVERLRRQLAADLRAEKPEVASSRRAWFGMLAGLAPRAALVLAVLCAAGGGYLAWDYQQGQPLYTGQFATRRGEQLDVALPDGSRLRLDTGTHIAVALYRQRREVRLAEGQAVFQVRGDRTRPFEVLAGPLRVTVVGTRFAVRHTPAMAGADGVRVAVEHGRVRVAAPATAPATAVIALGAGQQVVSDAAGKLGPVTALGAAGIAPWRDGRVSFDNQPLSVVLAEFERYGASGVTLADPRTAALRITGTFDPRRPDNFLRIVPQVLPVRLRRQNGVTEIAAMR
ncbi:FecR family protein [Janthinobacterium agaricidamnosum]|uniref:FecR family protein n=1 Tax=Janthinobacterium agaricidamnosum NBRC 102515 = DSM 9628 TaxID=1349767 RepID=W0VE65_9BURK|nr:FecR domain-containing protein [Janthinobacterium agaricidamnosum]CDG85965.1 fecR family protein [Janthinobacterium agaricidamnosum NBRC 102515 = DSM 9628]